MLLGRVIGTVVPAVVADGLRGTPFLWVQPLDRGREPAGEPVVCADGTRMAGPGEEVYWVASREAALTLEPSFVPVDHAVVGLVDDLRFDAEKSASSRPSSGKGKR
jgi:ethanolamine utilization protein EutN